MSTCVASLCVKLLDTDVCQILYGLPISPSAVPRLAAVVRTLGQGTVGLFVDHPQHVKLLDVVPESEWPGEVPIWVNIDTGYHREGVEAHSKQLADIAYSLSASKRTHLAGLYTHMVSSTDRDSMIVY